MQAKLLKQLFVYFWVGLGATVVEWLAFYALDHGLKLHYALATAIAFAVSTLANWYLGRLMLFKQSDPKGIKHELLSIYAVSIFGLLANLAIMAVAIEWCKTPDMTAKIIATGIVFLMNFLVRKIFIYKV